MLIAKTDLCSYLMGLLGHHQVDTKLQFSSFRS